jgi:hypothetical protein
MECRGRVLPRSAVGDWCLDSGISGAELVAERGEGLGGPQVVSASRSSRRRARCRQRQRGLYRLDPRGTREARKEIPIRRSCRCSSRLGTAGPFRCSYRWIFLQRAEQLGMIGERLLDDVHLLDAERQRNPLLNGDTVDDLDAEGHQVGLAVFLARSLVIMAPVYQIDS